MEIAFFLLLTFYFISSTFEYKYQSFVILISRRLHGKVLNEIRPLLTPRYILSLQGINLILLIGLAICAFFLFNWIFALGILLYGFVLSTFLISIIPLPTKSYCFRIILNTLEKEMYHHNNMIYIAELDELRKEILSIKSSKNKNIS